MFRLKPINSVGRNIDLTSFGPFRGEPNRAHLTAVNFIGLPQPYLAAECGPVTEASLKTEDWHRRVSQPKHSLVEERDRLVTMRDGVRLAVDIYRPEGAGQYPALLSCSPYGKDIQKVTETQRPLSPRHGNGGQEAGDSRYFVERGYVHVIADTRGSGNSEGTYNNYGLKEQQDGYDLIEWMAAQPWCDGNVGMLGMSYFGVLQPLVAATQPPHLKAIAPYEAYTDRYRHSVYHGGIFNEGFFHQWWGHVSIETLRPPIYDYLGENEIQSRRHELMRSPEVLDSPYLHIQLKYPEKNPLMFDFLLQPLDGPYYWERSVYTMFDKIKIPVLLMARWSGWPIHLAGAFQAWEGIDAPKKMIIMETEATTGPLRPWRDHQDILLRWYDHWLKGNDTGIMDEPPIRLLIKGRGEWRDEMEWPLERTRWTRLWLQADGLLSDAGPGETAAEDFANEPNIRPGVETSGLAFATPPFEREFEVTGPLALYLSAEIDREDATWIVTIKDRPPEGPAKIVTKGWLRASHRKLDADRSKPHQPYHSHLEALPVPPGEVVEYAIDLREMSMVFMPGHRLVVEVKGQDTPAEDPIWHHISNPHTTRHTLHYGEGHASYLLVPAIP